MKLVKKILLSVLIHIIWLSLIVIPGVFLLNDISKICDILVSPLMIGIVYPIVFIMLWIMIYKIKPLESKRHKKIYLLISCVLSILILVWSMPYFIVCIIENYSFTGM